MKLMLKATATIEKVDGVPARVWTGETGGGIPVKVWIPLIQVRADSDRAEFDRELTEIKATRELVSFDMRLVG